MIRYPIPPQELIDRINQHDKDWIKRAQERTREYAGSRDYTGGTEFWSKIKKVYIEIQHEKCAYCESKLQGMEYAIKVHEVEHYRPKSSVKEWPNASLKHLANFQAPCPTGAASETGYYQLAYHPFNYAIACTRCNSTFKSNYFPIRGERLVHEYDPTRMAPEEALLVYPISTLDENPEDLITFEGVLARPRTFSGASWERAETIIWFFHLNAEDLTSRRAELLAQLWLNLSVLQTPLNATLRQNIEAQIKMACDPKSQFSSCMKAFWNLYKENRARADEIGVAAQEFQRSMHLA